MTSARAPSARWRWILPLLLLCITVVLQAQFSLEFSNPQIRGDLIRRGMRSTTTTASINFLLSAPAWVIANILDVSFPIKVAGCVFDGVELIAVVIFWTWLGWMIDMRHDSAPTSLAYRVFWTIVKLSLAVVSADIAWSFLHDLRWLGWHSSVQLFREWGLRTSGNTSAVASVWFAAGAVYFCISASRLWRRKHSADPLQPVREVNWTVVGGLATGGIVGWFVGPSLLSDYVYRPEPLSITSGGLFGTTAAWLWGLRSKSRHR